VGGQDRSILVFAVDVGAATADVAGRTSSAAAVEWP
jgi:hypothetical protein